MKSLPFAFVSAALLVASVAQAYSIEGSWQVTAAGETRQEDPSVFPGGFVLDQTVVDAGSTRYLSFLDVVPRAQRLDLTASSFINSTCPAGQSCVIGGGVSTAMFQGVLHLEEDMLFSMQGGLEINGRNPLTGPVGSAAFRLVGLDNDVRYDYSAEAGQVMDGAAIFVEQRVLAAGAYQLFILATQTVRDASPGAFSAYASAGAYLDLRPVPIPAAAILLLSGLGWMATTLSGRSSRRRVARGCPA